MKGRIHFPQFFYQFDFFGLTNFTERKKTNGVRFPPVLQRGIKICFVCMAFVSQCGQTGSNDLLVQSRKVWLLSCPSHIIPHMVIPYDSWQLSQTPLREGGHQN